MGREFELKYRAIEKILEAIREQYPHLRPIAMKTHYYDTPGGALSGRKWMLRRRMENGVSVCTLKTPLPNGARGEWEARWDDITTAPAELCKLGAPAELVSLTAGGLVEVCGARFTRLAGIIELPGAQAELALDRGVLTGGGREVPLCEVEVEHKSGAEEETVAFARELAARFGLEPEEKSKFRRALDLR